MQQLPARLNSPRVMKAMLLARRRRFAGRGLGGLDGVCWVLDSACWGIWSSTSLVTSIHGIHGCFLLPGSSTASASAWQVGIRRGVIGRRPLLRRQHLSTFFSHHSTSPRLHLQDPRQQKSCSLSARPSKAQRPTQTARDCEVPYATASCTRPRRSSTR